MKKQFLIPKIEILMLFLLIPFIKLPDYIIGEGISKLLDLYKILSFGIILLLIIKNKKISKITILFAIFQMILIISTIINGNTDRIWAQIIQFFSVMGIVMYTDYFITTNTKSFFKVVGLYICLLATINSISMFLYYPQGMYIDSRLDRNYYFLQLDNVSFFIVYIGLICLIINSLLKRDKVTLPIYSFLTFQFISYLYVSSTTAYILCAVLIIFTFLYDKKRRINLNFNYCVIFIIIFALAISVFKVQNVFEDFLMNTMNRNATLTGRTLIWDRAFLHFKAKPIIGNGLENTLVMRSKVGFGHIHNIFIENLYKGGLTLSIVYFIILFVISQKMKKIKGTNIYNFLTFSFFIFLLICQFDYYNEMYICFAIYVILYNCEYLTNYQQKEKLMIK